MSREIFVAPQFADVSEQQQAAVEAWVNELDHLGAEGKIYNDDGVYEDPETLGYTAASSRQSTETDAAEPTTEILRRVAKDTGELTARAIRVPGRFLHMLLPKPAFGFDYDDEI